MPLACAIDFGTSNSAVALAIDGDTTLVNLEHRHVTMPTAVFFDAETNQVSFGRHAVQHYLEGTEGRLMRALKSVLGSALVEEATFVHGRQMRYKEIIATFLGHLKAMAESDANTQLSQLVIGRPVFFVDGDAARDSAAQSTLEECARSVGFTDVQFEFEPIAAALDYETTLTDEQITLVIDIGGGTSDFSVVRLGPARAGKLSRQDDILGNAGLHVGGTDFDQALSMASVMPLLGYKSHGPQRKEVPSWIYFDLATWHRINALHSSKMVHEVKSLVSYYGQRELHARLMTALTKRLGHLMLGRVDDAKIAAAETGSRAAVRLDEIEPGLAADIEAAMLARVLAKPCQAIVDTATRAVELAGLTKDRVQTLYFTGGSTGLPNLRDRLRAAFPHSKPVFGDPFASVARGLGVRASLVFA